ncbi:MAG: GreA/GreB family elongation factor [Candidatus Pacebacteria bacterium]|nr:GreA/GreB family elongation factor [Candidatus Paceibacterota bacterium]
MLTPPKRRWQKIRSLDDHGPIPLTPQAFERMKERFVRIKASLPALAAEAGRTADYGDRSDNAEYKEAKSLLRRANGQVMSLEDQLKRVVVIEADADTSGTVRLGSTVVLELKGPKDRSTRTTFRILGPYETDPGAGRISYKSPLGAALIGHVKGDEVAIKTELGGREYRIIEVK